MCHIDSSYSHDVLNKNVFWLKTSNGGWGRVCVSPKNGSSMWKRLFLKQRYPHLSLLRPHLENATVALNSRPGVYTPSQMDVLFFRNPIDRFISAYNDKILNPLNCKEMAPEGFHCQYPEVEHMVDMMMGNSEFDNPHFLPQSLLCDVKNITYISYDVGNIHEWYAAFVQDFRLEGEVRSGWKVQNELYSSDQECFFRCKKLDCSEMINNDAVKSNCNLLKDRQFIHTTHEGRTEHTTRLSNNIIEKLIKYYKDDYALMRRI